MSEALRPVAPQTPISSLSPQQAAALVLHRRKARADLRYWCETALAPLNQSPARHHRLLIEKLEAVSRGEIDRLMVLMPPGSAKSTYASVLFPAWWFAAHPRSTVIAASHTGDLAEHFGRQVRNLVDEHSAMLGYGLRADNKAVGSWSTTDGSQYFAVGVGGAVSGRRADCISGDTKVMTPQGEVRIDSIDITASPCYVLSYDERAKRPGYRRVLAFSRRPSSERWRIQSASGCVVEASGNHRFYVDGEWRPASAISVGDVLLRSLPVASSAAGKGSDEVDRPADVLRSGGTQEDTQPDAVALVERLCGDCDLYDIQVEGTQCFFANGVLVHNCIMVDDPVRSQEAADSERDRDKVWSWYQSDLMTRLKPGGRIVLIMTRWHSDDLGGRLLNAMKNGGDQWEVINLPALAGLDDPLDRKPGEALWPEWESAEALNRKRKNISARTWAALYQQTPTTEEGAILRRDMWQPWLDAAPRAPAMIVISLDTAYTEKTQNDPTGCTVWYLVEADYLSPDRKPGQVVMPPDARTKALLRFAWRERLPFPDLIEHIQDTVQHFGISGVPIRLLVEKKASGISVIQEMRRRMPDLIIHGYAPQGDKVSRVHAVTALFEGGRVYAMARQEADGPAFRPFADMVIDECAAFPVGQHDDLVDTCSAALKHFRDMGVEFFAEDEPPPARHGAGFGKAQF